MTSELALQVIATSVLRKLRIRIRPLELISKPLLITESTCSFNGRTGTALSTDEDKHSDRKMTSETVLDDWNRICQVRLLLAWQSVTRSMFSARAFKLSSPTSTSYRLSFIILAVGVVSDTKSIANNSYHQRKPCIFSTLDLIPHRIDVHRAFRP